MSFKVMPAITSRTPLNISETVRDRGLAPHQYGMAYGNRMVT